MASPSPLEADGGGWVGSSAREDSGSPLMDPLTNIVYLGKKMPSLNILNYS